MLKNWFKYAFSFLLITSFLFSCKKDNSVSNNQTYQGLAITPLELVGWIGKDWTTITPNLKMQQGFTSTLSSDKSNLIKIALPVIDSNAPIKQFRLNLYIYDSDNVIKEITLAPNNDSINMTMNDAYKLMLYYYGALFSSMLDSSNYTTTYSYQTTNPNFTEFDTGYNKIKNYLETNYQMAEVDFSSLYDNGIIANAKGVSAIIDNNSSSYPYGSDNPNSLYHFDLDIFTQYY